MQAAHILAAIILIKHHFFVMLSAVQKEYLNTESSLEETSVIKESSKIQRLVDSEKLERTSLVLGKEEIASGVKEVNRALDPQEKRQKF
jgi:hypothetical protein